MKSVGGVRTRIQRGIRSAILAPSYARGKICRKGAVVTLTPGKLRKLPYFKVQVYDPITLSWKDHRKEAFDDEASARAYQNTVPNGVKTRIIKWDETGSYPLG